MTNINMWNDNNRTEPYGSGFSSDGQDQGKEGDKNKKDTPDTGGKNAPPQENK